LDNVLWHFTVNFKAYKWGKPQLSHLLESIYIFQQEKKTITVDPSQQRERTKELSRSWHYQTSRFSITKEEQKKKLNVNSAKYSH
jgi:hypothetical protein